MTKAKPREMERTEELLSEALVLLNKTKTQLNSDVENFALQLEYNSLKSHVSSLRKDLKKQKMENLAKKLI